MFPLEGVSICDLHTQGGRGVPKRLTKVQTSSVRVTPSGQGRSVTVQRHILVTWDLPNCKQGLTVSGVTVTKYVCTDKLCERDKDKEGWVKKNPNILWKSLMEAP